MRASIRPGTGQNLWAEAQRQKAEHQAELDAWWQALLGNKPDTVLGTLAEAADQILAKANRQKTSTTGH